MEFLTHEELAFIFGLLGNIISFLVFLAPVPTFYRIYKKKSSEGFQSIPYLVALMSAFLLLYYGSVKDKAYLIISINAIGCAIEVIYIILFLIYASKEERIFTAKLVVVFNIGGCGMMMLCTMLLAKGSKRVTIVGWICAAFAIAVFAAPLSIMRRVIKTKSVEYMPLPLSFFLTLSAIAWFFYGFLIKDFFIALPNILGILFGLVQIGLYMLYKNSSKQQDEGTKEVMKTEDSNTVVDDQCCKEMKEILHNSQSTEPIKTNAGMV